MTRIDPERAANLYSQHRSLSVVAGILGATAEGVRQCLRRGGVKVMSRKQAMADPEVRARHRAGLQRHFAGCEVPSWVAADLRDDYIDVARLSGEEAAAHVRRLKREAAL